MERLFREHRAVYALGKPATTPYERAMAAALWTRIAFEDDHERRLFLESKGVRVIPVTYAQVRRRGTADRLRVILMARAAP